MFKHVHIVKKSNHMTDDNFYNNSSVLASDLSPVRHVSNTMKKIKLSVTPLCIIFT